MTTNDGHSDVPREIRVFIASPGDLAGERRAFKDAIELLNLGFGDGAGVRFVPLGWEDTLATTLHFANGAMATITGTTTTEPGFPHRIEIYGTRGGIQIEGEQVRRWDLANPEEALVEPPVIEAGFTDAGAGGDPRGIGAAGHIAIVRDFVQALRDDRPPLVDGNEGRRSLSTVLAVYEAAGKFHSRRQ